MLSLLDKAALAGNHEILVYLSETIPCTSQTLTSAIEGGNVDCLSFVFRKLNLTKFEYEDHIQLATKLGHLDCLKFIRDINNSHGFGTKLQIIAAANGHVHIMRYLFENGVLFGDTEDVCNAAAKNGHLECLKFAHEDGALWSDLTIDLAIINGHFDCFEYAAVNGCEMDEFVMQVAAREGKIAVIRYLAGKGMPVTEALCEAACSEGRLDMLKFLREELECPWNTEAIHYSIEGNFMDCLQYCLMNGCPLRVATLLHYIKRSKIENWNINWNTPESRIFIKLYQKVPPIHDTSLGRAIKEKMDEINMYKEYAGIFCEGIVVNDILEHVVHQYF